MNLQELEIPGISQLIPGISRNSPPGWEILINSGNLPTLPSTYRVSKYISKVVMLKGTGTLMILYVLRKSPIKYKPWHVIPVSPKSVEKWGSCGHLNICKWVVMEAAIL